MLVASRGDEVFALAIAVVDHVRFWKTFFTRHPLHALHVGWKRSGRGVDDAAIGGGPHPLSSPSWADTGPAIAKVLFIGVAPEDRREGCGQRLYAELFRHLREAGVARIDARIDLDNHASIRLHEATGWSVWRDGPSAFATRRL
jgi:ribosomal protein S18 acetylase RimI-like enzyme